MSGDGPIAVAPDEWLVAHRGYPARFPENSLEGMKAVLDAGARLVELDVQLSRDMNPVVSHDDSLQRVAGRGSRVTASSLARLGAISSGERERFGGRFDHARIPTVARMLRLIGQYPRVLKVFVDVKDESLGVFGRTNTIGAVMRVMADVSVPWAMLCADDEALSLARGRGAPEIGWVFDEWTPAARARADALGPDFLFTPARQVPATKAPFWPQAGCRWCVYDVNDAESALDLRHRGAELIETDCLPDLARTCRERAADALSARRG